MYRTILVATDGSESANKAVSHAASLAKASGAKLIIVNVTQLWSALDIAHEAEAGVRDPVGDYEKMAKRSAERVLDSASAIATTAQITPELMHVQDRAPAEGILSAATGKGADLIVMGTHGRRGIGRLLLGSQAAEVVARSDRPVLIVR